MRKTKRALSVLLSMAVVLSLLVVPAFASEETPCMSTEGCIMEDGHAGDCETAPAEGESTPEVDPAEPESAPGEEPEPAPGEEPEFAPESLASAEPEEAASQELLTVAADGYTEWTSTDSLPVSGTYRLTGDVRLETTFFDYPTVTGTLVLDLNGHTITVAGSGQYAYFLNSRNASLTIEDSAGGGKITNAGVSGSSKTLIQVNAGQLELKGGTLENTTSSGYALFVNSGSYASISGGTVVNTASNGYAVQVNSGSSLEVTEGTIRNTVDGGYAVFLNGEASLELSGGTIDTDSTYSSSAAIYANNTASRIVISGGMVESASRGVYAAFTPVTVTGGTVDTVGFAFQTRNATVAPAEGSSVAVQSETGIFYTLSNSNNKVEGGSFQAPKVVQEYTDTEGNQELTVTGGTFAGAGQAELLAYVPDGRTAQAQGNDTYAILPATEPAADSVAVVDGVYYRELANAVEAAGEEDTVTLVANVVLDSRLVVEAEKSLTLDLAAYTITPAEDFPGSILINNYGELTITGGEGTIAMTKDPTNGGVAVNVNGGTLSVRSGNIASTRYGIQVVGGGTANLSGGTISGAQKAVMVSGGNLHLSGSVHLTSEDVAAQVQGGSVTMAEDALLEALYGILLFNKDGANEEGVQHASLEMTGGTVRAQEGFAISGNNLQSAGCSAVVIGGSLETVPEGTAIYWPMEGVLTIGGTASVTGGTAIEAKMGTITIEGEAQITGTGAWSEELPENGGASPEGSALLASAQMYGAHAGQCITSPDLTVRITGGTLTSENGNAVTVYNTESTVAQTAQVTVTGGTLAAAEGRAALKVITSGGNTAGFVPNGDMLETSKSNTTVQVSGDAAAAAVDQDGKTSYYRSVQEALEANTSDAEDLHIYVLADSQVDRETLESEKVALTTAPGVTMQVQSSLEGWIVQATANADGSTTYRLVAAGTANLADPAVTVQAGQTTVHAGETIGLTAEASCGTPGVTYRYEWYRDGALLPGENGPALTVSASGSYTVQVTACLEQADGTTLYSHVVESSPVACTVTPHEYGTEWESDADSHWHACACGERADQAAHSSDGGVVTTPATATEAGVRTYRCTVCGRVLRTEAIPALGQEHVHTFGNTWKYDGTYHWHECACGEKADQAGHSFGAWKTTKQPTGAEAGSKERTCTVCGYTVTASIPSQGAVPPKTGDTSNLALYLVLLVAAGGGLAVVWIRMRRKER